MITEKIIQTRLEFTNSSAMSTDIDSVIMDMLRERYKNRCYAASYILDILEIIRKSDLICSKTQQNSSFVASVMFRAKVLIVKQYDIIHNCVVKKIDNRGNFICQNKYASIYIKPHLALQKIKRGQTIVALAVKIAYDIYKPEISIVAYPFIPVVNKALNTIYKTTVCTDTPLYDAKLIEFRESVKKLKTHDQKVVEFFHELLYPFKERTKYNSLQKKHKLSTVQEPKFTSGQDIYMSIHNTIPNESYQIIKYNIDPQNSLESKQIQEFDGSLVISESYDLIISTFVQYYIEHNNNVSNLASTYNTMDIIKKNNVLWDIYRNYRV